MALADRVKPDPPSIANRRTSPPCWKCEYYLPDLTRGIWGCRHPSNIGGLTDSMSCGTIEGYCDGFRYRSIIVDDETWERLCYE